PQAGLNEAQQKKWDSICGPSMKRLKNRI
ncbi:hypothetical protein LCGC14_3090980, partial [marine sediment metagenome]